MHMSIIGSLEGELPDFLEGELPDFPVGERLKKQIGFLIEADKMKNVLRQSLILDKTRRENDAEHTWHIALMAAVLHEHAHGAGVDLHRVLKMVLVHDLVEIYAGDTFAYDDAGYADKIEREAAAADKVFGILPAGQGGELRALWAEFDLMETPDAKYAAAIDRLQPLLANYVTGGHTWKLFGGITSDKVYKRMEIIRDGAPGLWGLAATLIEASIKRGYLKEPKVPKVPKSP